MWNEKKNKACMNSNFGDMTELANSNTGISE